LLGPFGLEEIGATMRSTSRWSLLLAVLMACTHAPPAPGSTGEPDFVTTADGTRLWFRKLGSGTPVVVIPGAFMLEPDFDVLAEGRTVVLYDPRNRARSAPVTEERISIQNDVADLEAIRAHLGAERIVPVGWSYFGLMVALYAQAHPDRVERLVQLGPVGPVPGTKYEPPLSEPNSTLPPDVQELYRQAEDAKATGSIDPAGYCRTQQRFLRRLLVNDPTRGDRFPDQCGWEREWPVHLEPHFQQLFRSILRTSVTRDSAAGVQVPVLIIHGRRDRNAPYGGGLDWAKVWADTRLITLDNAAHALWIDDPSVFQDLDRFLKGEWPASAVRP
jgi:pimeloyl-ACP methyl ester carboxylesterase